MFPSSAPKALCLILSCSHIFLCSWSYTAGFDLVVLKKPERTHPCLASAPISSVAPKCPVRRAFDLLTPDLIQGFLGHVEWRDGHIVCPCCGGVS